jgi:hypothetical protein
MLIETVEQALSNGTTIALMSVSYRRENGKGVRQIALSNDIHNRTIPRLMT